mgnify:CR=1 FL=1
MNYIHAVAFISSFISTQTMIGTPAEIYKFGSSFGYFVLAAPFGALVGVVIFQPVFRKLKLTSIYEVCS